MSNEAISNKFNTTETWHTPVTSRHTYFYRKSDKEHIEIHAPIYRLSVHANKESISLNTKQRKAYYIHDEISIARVVACGSATRSIDAIGDLADLPLSRVPVALLAPPARQVSLSSGGMRRALPSSARAAFVARPPSISRVRSRSCASSRTCQRRSGSISRIPCSDPRNRKHRWWSAATANPPGNPACRPGNSCIAPCPPLGSCRSIAVSPPGLDSAARLSPVCSTRCWARDVTPPWWGAAIIAYRVDVVLPLTFLLRVRLSRVSCETAGNTRVVKTAWRFGFPI